MKPILFNSEMVRAILEGRKSVTRRLIKPQPVWSQLNMRWDWGEIAWWRDNWKAIDSIPEKNKPYKIGDILYVRETWAEMPYGFVYRADDEHPVGWDREDRWTPSIHMPKDVARIFLKVTGISVHRLNEMTEEDAIAEGFPDLGVDADSPSERFSNLWDKTIKPSERGRYGWYGDPWVVAIDFVQIEKHEAMAYEEYNGMTHKERYNFLAERGSLCEACRFQFDCKHTEVTGGPNGPVYPLCCDHGPEFCIDNDYMEEAIVQAIIAECIDAGSRA